jgi:hypothetical protein
MEEFLTKFYVFDNEGAVILKGLYHVFDSLGGVLIDGSIS